MYYTIVNDPEEEYFIVGDVHGSLDQLVINYNEYCVERKTRSKLKLIYTGDYLDRGSDVGIIDAIKNIQQSQYASDIIFMCGNHEVFKYVATLSDTYDPTVSYASRLEFYAENNIKLCYAYVNVAKKLIISHAGINFNHIGSSIVEIDMHCASVVANLRTLTTFIINGDVSHTLSQNDAKIHDETFYGLVDTWADITPETIAKSIDRTQWLQIFGHFHDTFIVSDLGEVFPIEIAQFATYNHVKFICIDSSDYIDMRSYLEIDVNNHFHWRYARV
jgi:hypothetical protein